MAGSFEMLIAQGGSFQMDLIENMGDAHEALEDCFNLIAELSGGDMAKVSRACRAIGTPDPYDLECDRCEDDPMPAPMRRVRS